MTWRRSFGLKEYIYMDLVKFSGVFHVGDSVRCAAGPDLLLQEVLISPGRVLYASPADCPKPPFSLQVHSNTLNSGDEQSDIKVGENMLILPETWQDMNEFELNASSCILQHYFLELSLNCTQYFCIQ